MSSVPETFGSGDVSPSRGGATAGTGDLGGGPDVPSSTVGAGSMGALLGSMTPEEQNDFARQMREMGDVEHEYARFFHEHETLEEIGAAIAEYEAEKQAALEAEEERWAAKEAELAQREADMAAAHARGEAFHWDDITYDGQEVQEWILPGGTTILVNEAGEAVSIVYPPGEGPVYQGDVMHEGEIHALYELPTGAMVLIDSDGTTVAYDELAIDEIIVDKFLLTDDPNDIGEQVAVQLVPMGPPSYDTEVIDATTGEVLDRYETGQYQAHTGRATYVPPGAETGYYINADGEPYAEYVPPPEEVWSILGVTYYDDGNVSVDLGVAEVNVDLIGPEKGVSVELELLLGEGTVGIEWNEDGSWEFIAEAEIETDAFDLSLETFVGRDEKGNMYGGFEAATSVNLGLLTVSGGMYADLQMTGDGFEASMGQWGEVGAFGAYIRRADDLTIVYDEDEGVTATQTFTLGAGIKGLGEIAVTTQTQVHTDGTLGGTTAGGGAHITANDSDGNQLAGAGAYRNSEGESWTSSGLMDDGTGYDPNKRDQLPAESDGSADFQFHEGDDAGDEGGRTWTGPGGDRDGARSLGADGIGSRSAFDEDGPLGAGRARNETTIPGSIDPTSPIGAVGGASGPGAGRPGAALSDGPAGPGVGRDRADGVYVQERASGIADGLFDQQVPRGPGGPDSVGVSERSGRPGQDRSDETDAGFEPITLERGAVGADRASGSFGDRVDGMSPIDRGSGPGLRGQPDPEERSATDRSTREGVPPIDAGEGDGEGDGDGDGGVGLPPEPPSQEPPGGGDADEPPPDASPPTDMPPGDDVPFGVQEFDADDITSPRPVGAIGGDAGPLRSPTVDAATGGFGDRLDRPVGDVGPNRGADDITGPPVGARLPDRPSIGDRPMGDGPLGDRPLGDRPMSAASVQDDSFHAEATVEIGVPMVEVTVEVEMTDDADGSFGADGFGPDTNGDDDGALGGPRGSDGPGLGDQFDQPGS